MSNQSGCLFVRHRGQLKNRGQLSVWQPRVGWQGGWRRLIQRPGMASRNALIGAPSVRLAVSVQVSRRAALSPECCAVDAQADMGTGGALCQPGWEGWGALLGQLTPALALEG